MNNLILKCGDKEIEVREIHIEQGSLGASIADGKMLFDHGFKDGDLTANGLAITGTWSLGLSPDFWILEIEESGEKVRLPKQMGVGLTLVSQHYPIDDYLIVIGKAGGRSSRMQFDVYSHLDIKHRVATMYYSLWGKDGRSGEASH